MTMSPEERKASNIYSSIIYSSIKRRADINWKREDFIAWYIKTPKVCDYCRIEEKDFIQIWDYFYPRKLPNKTVSGRYKLEIDRKDNEKGYSLENCALACPICNNAKSDKFTYEEFKKVGKVINQIWNERES